MAVRPELKARSLLEAGPLSQRKLALGLLLFLEHSEKVLKRSVQDSKIWSSYISMPTRQIRNAAAPIKTKLSRASMLVMYMPKQAPKRIEGQK